MNFYIRRLIKCITDEVGSVVGATPDGMGIIACTV